MQVAVLAVVDLAGAFVDLQRDADVAPREDRFEVALGPFASNASPMRFFTASERPAAMRTLR